MVKSKRGAILLVVLIMVLTISLLGATLMALFFNVLSLSQIELDRARALYLAEAGVAMAVSRLKGGGVTTPAATQSEAQPDSTADERPDRIIPPTRLGDGYFEVYNNYSDSTIISIGTSNSVKRTIQMRYNAF
jgi:Tfp pilus assembly protein PilX